MKRPEFRSKIIAPTTRFEKEDYNSEPLLTSGHSKACDKQHLHAESSARAAAPSASLLAGADSECGIFSSSAGTEVVTPAMLQ